MENHQIPFRFLFQPSRLHRPDKQQHDVHVCSIIQGLSERVCIQRRPGWS